MKINLVLKYIFLILLSFGAMGQSIASKEISGSIWDDSTGVDLPCDIYGHTNSRKLKIASTNAKNIFEFNLPKGTDSLSFKANGYDEICLPIYFY